MAQRTPTAESQAARAASESRSSAHPPRPSAHCLRVASSSGGSRLCGGGGWCASVPRPPSPCRRPLPAPGRSQCAARPRPALKASSSTSHSVGCVWTVMASSGSVVPCWIAFAHSWMRSAAWIPMMCTATTSYVPFLKMTLAMPSPSPSASALELALKLPCEMPISQPSFSARSLACSSVGPTMAISGWVKQAAGTASWLSTCSCPHIFSTAEMPCADAACASIILPLRSPMHHRPSITLPSLSSARIFSSTGTKPRLVWMLTASKPRPSE
mmetsp:Transcript_29313/g.94488  ORF Transcript_29313/g.94488 Transcript_29313/m.94488 type:complete len:271 (+) Transcript_29313:546-1358(+)